MSSPNITLYSTPTPNGVKVSILLEELGIPYTTHPIDLMKNEQKEEWFLKINPNGRIPALTDGDQRIFESGAIMLYLVDKYDLQRKISYEPGTPGYFEQLSWLMWQVAGLGPMQGQAHHFTSFASVRSDYGIKRYMDETKRLYSILDARLQESAYLAGEKFTIADIASFTWVRVAPALLELELGEWPALKKWHDGILGREAVQRGLKIPASSVADEKFHELVLEKRREIQAMDNSDLH